MRITDEELKLCKDFYETQKYNKGGWSWEEIITRREVYEAISRLLAKHMEAYFFQGKGVEGEIGLKVLNESLKDASFDVQETGLWNYLEEPK